jgi:signal transduction histidine kinase
MSARSRSQEAGGSGGLSLTNALRDCLACGVLVVDGRKKIVSCTAEASRLLRLEQRETANGPLSLLPAALQKIIREVVSTKKPVTERTVTLPPHGSDSTALHVNTVPVQSGDSLHVVVVLNDIGVARRLEENMRRLDRLASIGTLSAGMGHEIKNALVAVKTFVDLLLEKNQDSELTEVVRRELRRIDSIVSQMLKFAGPARPTFAAVRLHDVLDHSLRLVQHQLEGKLISLKRSFKAAPDAIKGDAHQLEQAFVNLFLNAVEAMGTNGSLVVHTEIVPAAPAKAARSDPNRHPQVHITIADTGIGVTPENMGRLFEPFFTTKNHGTGLGLPITRRIMQEHHGEISVHSEVNHGTTFSILLPASAGAH